MIILIVMHPSNAYGQNSYDGCGQLCSYHMDDDKTCTDDRKESTAQAVGVQLES